MQMPDMDEAQVDSALTGLQAGENLDLGNAPKQDSPTPKAEVRDKLGSILGITFKTKAPTLDNHKIATSAYNEKNGNFSEHSNANLSNLTIEKTTPFGAQLAGLKDVDPAERAQVGAKFGGGIGLAVGGLHGGVVGAAVGAMGARGVGLAQSGNNEVNSRREKVINAFKNLSAVDKKGYITFSDGAMAPLNNDSTVRLKNLNPSLISGKKDRATYEIDPTHPMTNRTYAVARPIGRYIAQGLMNFNNQNNQHDTDAIDHTTGMLINAFQQDAQNIDHVYGRAKETLEKLKINKTDIHSFYDQIKDTISSKEAQTIKRGLEILYA